MSVPRIYLDTNVFIAAFEMTGAHSDHAWWILKGIEAGTIIGVTSEITLAEVLVKPMERDDEALADAYEGMIAPAPYFETVSVGRDVLTTAARLRAGRRSLRLPDAIHVASAQIAQCGVFITQDERIALPDDLRRLGVTPFTLGRYSGATMTETSAPLLSVQDLSVAFRREGREQIAVNRVSFDVKPGETVALVGESGSGKSVTALSVLKLLPYPSASHPTGRILLKGRDLLTASDRELRAVRGNDVTMVFQEPMTSLNPLHTIDRQIGEMLILHRGLSGAAVRTRTLELLHEVGIPDPESRLGAYPHQLSGGQRQRVMIAMALANEPDLLIADEPTTALDVTVQAQILKLLKDLQARRGMAMLFITHDLGIVRKIADRVCVMQKGEIVEQGGAEETFLHPKHPYTQALLKAEPKPDPAPAAPEAKVVVSAQDLKVHFPIKRGILRRTVGHVKAVDGVSVEIHEGETLGVVGESGSGKTTLGLALLRLISSKGPIAFLGQRVDGLSFAGMRPLRAHMQIVFQDPFGALSPRMSVADIVEEGLLIHQRKLSQDEREARVIAALQDVGLDPESRFRYPHEFSGGQRQRISIARAMALEPSFVVLDEPTSALDMLVQAQIVDLLRALQRKRSLTYMFISHDLRVVSALASRILVMRNGKVVEEGPAREVFEHPREAYTQALFAAAFNIETAHAGVTAQ